MSVVGVVVALLSSSTRGGGSVCSHDEMAVDMGFCFFCGGLGMMRLLLYEAMSKSSLLEGLRGEDGGVHLFASTLTLV